MFLNMLHARHWLRLGLQVPQRGKQPWPLLSPGLEAKPRSQQGPLPCLSASRRPSLKGGLEELRGPAGCWPSRPPCSSRRLGSQRMDSVPGGIPVIPPSCWCEFGDRSRLSFQSVFIPSSQPRQRPPPSTTCKPWGPVFSVGHSVLTVLGTAPL